MGGSGGHNRVYSESPNWYRQAQKFDHSKYDAKVNGYLEELSSSLGARDSAAIHGHMDVLRSKLQADFIDTIELEYGGSMAKHTYVDGISDVDLLAVMERKDLEGMTSMQLIGHMERLFRERLPGTDIQAGQMAVTLRYSDGTELQVLPALKVGAKVRVPGGKYTDEDWSPVAHPRGFAKELQRVNFAQQMQVLPAIKLFKALQDTRFGEDLHLSGYHTEAIAVKAFRDYDGARDRKSMLRYLIRSAGDEVKAPIRDTTGQSDHVDTYMGPEGSTRRQRVATRLAQLDRALEAAEQSGDDTAWQEQFGF